MSVALRLTRALSPTPTPNNSELFSTNSPVPDVLLFVAIVCVCGALTVLLILATVRVLSVWQSSRRREEPHDQIRTRLVGNCRPCSDRLEGALVAPAEVHTSSDVSFNRTVYVSADICIDSNGSPQVQGLDASTDHELKESSMSCEPAELDIVSVIRTKAEALTSAICSSTSDSNFSSLSSAGGKGSDVEESVTPYTLTLFTVSPEPVYWN